MLTDTGLRKLCSLEKSFKVAGSDGTYVTVSAPAPNRSATTTDLNDRRETVTIDNCGDTAGAKLRFL